MVAQGVLAGAYGAAHADLGHVLVVEGAGRIDEGDRQRALLVLLRRIAQHAQRALVLVDEVEGDAGLFEHAGEEVEVGLAVLHAVLARLELAGDVFAHVDVPLAQQLTGDLELALRLEDAVVAALGSEPQARP